jgi:uncharacterized protein YodC (DUF2158 family)
MATFNEGDVVNRIIGGPLMTVEKLRTDQFVATVWFDTDGRVQRDCFAPHTLQKWLRVED